MSDSNDQIKEVSNAVEPNKAPDIQEIIKTAIEATLNAIKQDSVQTTQQNQEIQTRIGELVKNSQARVITPQEVDIDSEPDTLKFVKDTIKTYEQNRRIYGSYKTRADDMAKNRILAYIAVHPDLTPEEVHKHLYLDSDDSY